MQELKTLSLFDPGRTSAGEYLSRFTYPWQALSGIADFIREFCLTLNPSDYEVLKEGVFIAKSAKVSASAFIGAPCYIGPEAEVRHCAFIRGAAFIGAGAVVGNSSEIKNSILSDGAQAPHFNYIGDSILGHLAHMGAGAITSNLKSDKSPVTVKYGGAAVDTGLRKFGAILGDLAEIGCNSVLNPGAVIGRGAVVYPLSSVRGYVPAGHIYKAPGVVVKKEAR